MSNNDENDEVDTALHHNHPEQAFEFCNLQASNQQGDEPNMKPSLTSGFEKLTESKSDQVDDKKLKFDGLVISILGLTALTNSAYAIIAPFLPVKFEAKGIDAGWIGYVFSSYSIAVIVFSPLCGSLISVTGRVNLIIMGIVLMGLSFIAFGLISYIEDVNMFIVLSLLARFIQGMASGLIQTTMYSITANFFPDNKEEMIGYIEAVTGVGLGFGPLMGSALYAVGEFTVFGGYTFIFYAFGTFLIVCSFFVRNYFPPSIENLGQKKVKDDDNFHMEQEVQDNGSDFFGEDEMKVSTGETQNVPKIGALELFKHPKFIMAGLSGTLGYFLAAFLEPVLAIRAGEFGLNQVQVGLFFMINPLVYIPTSILVQLVPQGVEKRAIIIFACFLSFFTNLFVGPSEIFSFPNTLTFAIIGQIMKGFIEPFILIPCLPEMIESVLSEYPEECENQINDIISGMFNMFLGFGQILGPLIGSNFTAMYGFRIMSDIVALICLVFAIVYYITCDGGEAISDSMWTNDLVDPNDPDGVYEHEMMSVRTTSVIAPINGILSPCSLPYGIRRFQVNSIQNKSNYGKDDGSFRMSGYDGFQQSQRSYNSYKMQPVKSLNTQALNQKLKKWQNKGDDN